MILLFNKMMKYYFLLVLLYLVHAQDLEKGSCLDSQTFTDDECFQLSSKIQANYYCCIVEVTQNDDTKYRMCRQIYELTYTEQEYSNTYKDHKKSELSAKDISVDCRLNYQPKPESGDKPDSGDKTDSGDKSDSGTKSDSRSNSNYLYLKILSLLILLINII